MPRWFISMLPVLLFVSGCALSQNEAVTLTLPPTTTIVAQIPTLPPTQSPTVEPTSTPQPTPTDSPSASRSVAAVAPQESDVENCQQPEGWRRHTVQRGETLYGIARTTGSTVTALADANCLRNVNQLTVGQVLFVPVTVSNAVASSPTATPEPQSVVVVPEVEEEEGLAIQEPTSDDCDDLFFDPTFEAEDSSWCSVAATQRVSAIIQSFEGGYMLWHGGLDTVYILRRDSAAVDGGLSEPWSGRIHDGLALPEPPAGRYLPDTRFLPYWNPINDDLRFPDIGWATAPASAYTMRVQQIDQTGWTSSALSWGPRFFIDWSLGSEALAVGNRAWSFAGTVDDAPLGSSRPITPLTEEEPAANHEPLQDPEVTGEPLPDPETTDEPLPELTEEPVTG